MRRYDYRGWARYRLSSQLEQVENLWDSERGKRLELAQTLLLEQKGHADKTYELREVQKLREKQEDAQHDLQMRVRSAEESCKVAQDQLQLVRREKRELQQKINMLQEDVRRAEEDVSKATLTAREEAGKVESLRRENVLDAEHASAWEKREKAWQHDREGDWEKRMKEMLHHHEIEQQRWQAERIAETNTLQRVQLERQYADEALEKARHELVEKQERILALFAEVEKLEGELRECDVEAEELHGLVKRLQDEKRALQAQLNEQRELAAKELSHERAAYAQRLEELRREHSALVGALKVQAEQRELALREARDAHTSTLKGVQGELAMSQEEVLRLERAAKDEFKQELKDSQGWLDERRQLQAEATRLSVVLEKTQKAASEEHKGLLQQLQAAHQRAERLQDAIQELRGQLLLKGEAGVDEATELQRQIALLEEKQRRLATANTELAVDKETLLVSELHLRQQVAALERDGTEKTSSLEIAVDQLRKQKEQLETKLKRLQTEHAQDESELAEARRLVDELRKEVQQVGLLERKVELLESAAHEKELQVAQELIALQEQLAGWKQKVRVAERGQEAQQKELAKAKLRERQAADVEKQLRGQLGDALGRLQSLEADVRAVERQKAEAQAKLLADLEAARHTSTDVSQKALQADRERERSYRELLDQVRQKAADEQKTAKVEAELATKAVKDQLEAHASKIARLQREAEAAEKAAAEKEAALAALKVQLQDARATAGAQSDSDRLLASAQADAKEQRNKALALDADKKAVELERASLAGKASRLESQLKELEFNAQRDAKIRQELEEKEQKARLELAAQLGEVKGLKDKLTELRGRSSDMEKELGAVSQEKARLLVELQQAKANDRVGQLEAAVARSGKELAERESKARADETKGEQERVKLVRDSDALRGALVRAQNEAERLQKAHEDLKEAKVKLEKRLQEAVSEAQQKTTQLGDLERQVRQLTFMNQSRNAEQSAADQGLKTEIIRLNGELSALQQRFEGSKADVLKAETALQAQKEASSEVERELTRQREEADEDLTTLAADLDQAQQDAKAAQAELASLRSDKDKAGGTLKKAEDALREERARLEAAAKKVERERDEAKRAHEQEKSERSNLAQLRTQLEGDLAKTRALLATRTGDLERLQGTLRAHEGKGASQSALEKELVTLKAQHQELEATMKAFEEENEDMRAALSAKEKESREAKARHDKELKDVKDVAAKAAVAAASAPSIKVEEPKSSTEEPKPSKEEGGKLSPVKDAEKEKADKEADKKRKKLEEELHKEKKRVTDLEEKLTKATSGKDEKKWAKEKSEYKKQVQKLQKELTALRAAAPTPPAGPAAIEGDPMIKAVTRIQSLIRGRQARKLFKSVHQRRSKIVAELLSSEQTYVRYIKVLVDTYVTPLRALRMLPNDLLLGMFGNIEEIYFNNTKLREQLEERLENWHVEARIGDVMVKAMALLQAHSSYCEHFSKMAAVKNEVLAGKVELENKSGVQMLQQFFQIARLMPQSDLKTVDDLLIMPVQRVPRYKLLLTELYEKTPKTHPDYKELQQALNLTQRLALSINENTRQAEAQSRFAQLHEDVAGLEVLSENPHRGLLDRRDKLPCMLGGGKVQVTSVVLLTDAVLFAQTNKKKRSSILSLGTSDKETKPFKVVAAVPFAAALVVELAATASLHDQTYENVLTVGSNYIVLPTPETAQEWLRTIKALVQKLTK